MVWESPFFFFLQTNDKDSSSGTDDFLVGTRKCKVVFRLVINNLDINSPWFTKGDDPLTYGCEYKYLDVNLQYILQIFKRAKRINPNVKNNNKAKIQNMNFILTRGSQEPVIAHLDQICFQ